MAGKITSLGLGSSVLNADVIDKLRQADEDNVIKPVDKKMELNIEKQKQLVEIKTSLDVLRGHAKKLSDYSTFLGRNVSVSGDCVKANATAGVPIQNVNMEVKQLAKSDINEVGTKFASRDDVFSKEDGVLDFFSDGKTYRVDIKAGMTVGEVSQAVTDATNAKVIGSIMKIGGEKPYQLMINSKETGENNRVYFGSVLKSEGMSNSDVELKGEEDFYLELKGTDGKMHKISVTLEIPQSSQDRFDMLRTALKEAMKKNDATKDLVDNGDISFGLMDEGRGFVVNDKRGFKISVGGEKTGRLGFMHKDSKTDDLYVSNVEIKGGALKGTFQINAKEIDLAQITKKENSAEDNAKAIVEAINAIEGMRASTEDNKLKLNSDGIKIEITAVSQEQTDALKSIGLKEGKFSDFSVMQKDLFKLKNVQSAADSEVLYNGATIRRSGNTLDDVVGGLTITLQKASEEGKEDTISITQNTDDIIKEVQEFVKVYNDTVPKLDAVTKFDPDTNRGGVFNTETIIRNIRPNLNQAITQRIGSGVNLKSLMDFGITINDKSVMSLDTGKLSSAISADPDKAKEVFYGGEIKDTAGKYNKFDGIFVKVNKVLADLLEGGNAKLTTFEQTLERELKNYTSERDKAKKMLDARYDTMAQRFAAFDEQIARTNNSFNAVQMMIDQAAGNDKKK